MECTIRVKGIGKAEAKADLVTLMFELSTIDLDYGKSFRKMEMNVADFRSTMEKLGFEKGTVKSTSFTVNERTRYTEKRNIFLGFEITHRMQVSFDFNSRRLAEVLSALKSSLANPSIQLSFSTKEQDALKKRVLENAVHNARDKAEIIAAASGCQLGKLLNIDYSWSEIHLESDFKYLKCAQSPMVMENSIDIDPEDVEAEDTIAVIWEIVNG